MPFLDVPVTNKQDQFCPSVFRKETVIGLFTTYLGFALYSYKVGLVRSLLHRAFMTSTSRVFFMRRLLKLSII